MAKANGDTSLSLLAQQNAPPLLPPLSDNSPPSGLVPQSEGNIPSGQPPAADKETITMPPISPSQSSDASMSKGAPKPLPDVPPTQVLQQTGGDTSLGFSRAEEPGEMIQSISYTDSSHEGNTTKPHTHSEQTERPIGVPPNSNSTGSSVVSGTRPVTWMDSRILTTSPQSLPLSVPEAQIDLPVEQRDGDMHPGPVTLSKSTQASELPRSPDEQGDVDPPGKIAVDLSQPVAVNNVRPVSMIQSPVEQVNSSPKIAKRNESNDSTSSLRPLGFDATVGNSENPQTVASAERERGASQILPAPQSHDSPIENQRAGKPQPRSRSSSIGDAGEGSQGRLRGEPPQEGGDGPPRQGEGPVLALGVGPPPPRYSTEGSMDVADVSPKKKRGLLSIICPCFG